MLCKRSTCNRTCPARGREIKERFLVDRWIDDVSIRTREKKVVFRRGKIRRNMFCNGAQLFGEKNECTSNLNIIDNFEAQVGNDKYIYINGTRKERETQESGREIGKTKRFNQTNSNLKVIRASLFSKGETFRAISRGGKGERGAKDGR